NCRRSQLRFGERDLSFCLRERKQIGFFGGLHGERTFEDVRFSNCGIALKHISRWNKLDLVLHATRASERCAERGGGSRQRFAVAIEPCLIARFAARLHKLQLDGEIALSK